MLSCVCLQFIENTCKITRPIYRVFYYISGAPPKLNSNLLLFTTAQLRLCCPLILLTLSSKAANEEEALSRIFCCEFNCSSYEATSALDNSLSTGVLSKRPRPSGIDGEGELKFLDSAGL